LHVSEEEALIRACVAGDAEAWRRFMARYSDWILRVASASLRRLGGLSPSDAEDARSEVFRQLVDRDRAMLRSLRAPYNLRAWLAIVTRRAAGKLRQRKVPPASPRRERRGADPSTDLLDLLPRLSPEDRLVLELFFVNDASYEEIGGILGMSAESIGKAKYRALEKLKALAQEAGLE